MASGLIREMMPRTPQGKAVTVGAALDSLAFGMYLAVATLYFVGVEGLPAVEIAVALSAANICGLLSPLAVGPLADRIGVRPVYLGLLILRAVLFAGYTLVHDVAGYVVTTCLLAAATRAGVPLLQAIVGKYEGSEHRVRTMAAMRSIANIGLGAGFLAAAAVQTIGNSFAFDALFLACALALATVAVVTAVATGQRRVPASGVPVGPAKHIGPVGTGSPGRSPYRDTPFLVFSLGYAVLLLHDSMLFVVLPLWLVEGMGLPAATSSVLLTVNTVLSVVLQLYVARVATGTRAPVMLMRGTCVCLVLACALLWLMDQRSAWVALIGATIAVVLLTVAENLQSVAGWEISYAMSTEPRRAQYLSIFSMTTTAQMIVGPALLTVLVIRGGPGGWLLVALGFVAAAAAIDVILRRRPAPSAAETVEAAG